MADERLDPRRDRLRHPQQLQRVAGRRRVEDDEVVVRGTSDDEVDHAIEQRDLGEPGRRRGHVDLLVSLSDDVRTEHPLDVALDVADVAPRLLFGVDLHGGEPRQDLALRRADPLLEDVRGRVRGIGRDQQDVAAAAARRQRERRRAGGLPDPALAAEEDDLLREQIVERVQQHGRLPIGECSIPIRRCQRWNCSRR